MQTVLGNSLHSLRGTFIGKSWHRLSGTFLHFVRGTCFSTFFGTCLQCSLGTWGQRRTGLLPQSKTDYLLAFLMVAVAMAFLFIACRTLLFVFPVNDSLIHLYFQDLEEDIPSIAHHLALLLVHGPTSFLAGSVKHCSATSHCELIAMLLVSNALGFEQELLLSC